MRRQRPFPGLLRRFWEKSYLVCLEQCLAQGKILNEGHLLMLFSWAVNPTLKQELPPNPHPRQIPARRPSLESSFRVGGTTGRGHRKRLTAQHVAAAP